MKAAMSRQYTQLCVVAVHDLPTGALCNMVAATIYLAGRNNEDGSSVVRVSRPSQYSGRSAIFTVSQSRIEQQSSRCNFLTSKDISLY